MKNSELKWIKEIPSGWKVEKIKLHMKRYEPKNPGNKEVLSVYREYGVIPKDSRSDNHNVTSDDTSKYKYVVPGDLVINKMKAWQGSMGISEFEGIVSPAYFIYKIYSSEINGRFIHYLFRNCYKDEFRRISGGIREGQWDLSPFEFENTLIIIPSLYEQETIVNFLDKKCAEIDLLIEDIQSQLKELSEYRITLINKFVLRGLYSNRKMKFSGDKWIGSIPEEWMVSRLSYETYIRARLGWKGLKADEYVDEGYAFLSAVNIQNGKLVWDSLNYITKERYDESPEIKIQVGDVLIVKDGAGVGKCARVDELPKGETSPNSSIAVITPNQNHDYRYICYYLQSAVFNNFVLSLYNGMGVPHLTQEIMNSIKVPIPSFIEQKQIADYLDKVVTEIDGISNVKEKELLILQDLKKSLIYEYITGKKEVV